jgi:hypothetical protein
MANDRGLADVGKNLSRSKLAHQGKVHVGLAQTYAAELSKVGWTSANTVELSKAVTELESAISAQAKVKDEAHLTSSTLDQAIADTKEFLRKLRTALPVAIRELPSADGVEAMFKVGNKLGGSAAKLSSYMAKIQPAIVKLEVPLTALLGGVSALAQLESLRTQLDVAVTAHGVARLRLPKTTQAVNEAKGAVADCLRNLLERARVAFVDKPDLVAQFSLRSLGPVRSTQTVVHSVPVPPPTLPAPAPPVAPRVSPPNAGAAVMTLPAHVDTSANPGHCGDEPAGHEQ